MRLIAMIGGMLAGVIVGGALTFFIGSQIATHTTVADDDLAAFIDGFFNSLLVGGTIGGWLGFHAAGRAPQER